MRLPLMALPLGLIALTLPVAPARAQGHGGFGPVFSGRAGSAFTHRGPAGPRFAIAHRSHRFHPGQTITLYTTRISILTTIPQTRPITARSCGQQQNHRPRQFLKARRIRGDGTPWRPLGPPHKLWCGRHWRPAFGATFGSTRLCNAVKIVWSIRSSTSGQRTPPRDSGLSRRPSGTSRQIRHRRRDHPRQRGLLDHWFVDPDDSSLRIKSRRHCATESATRRQV